jgi:outer membrane protein insertion porin family
LIIAQSGDVYMTIKKIPHFTRASFFIIAALIYMPYATAGADDTEPLLQAKDFNSRPAPKYELENVQEQGYIIDKIHVLGSHSLSEEAILAKSLFKPREKFNVNKTSQTIKNIYQTGYFQQVKIGLDTISDTHADLYIIVQEKPKLHHISYVGNRHLADKEIAKALDVEHIPTINESELDGLVAKVLALYHKKNYHHAQVTARLEPAQIEGQSDVVFTIIENQQSFIERISFRGNRSISAAQLKKFIYSKEEWLFSILDKSGSYLPAMVDADKAMIADVYKSNGYMKAQVSKTDIELSETTNNYHITYHIHEGDQYFIEKINIPGNDILAEDVLKSIIPLQEGMPYSLEKVRNSIESLRTAWSDFGYIFADIDPQFEINEEAHTVAITFYSDLKNKIYLNRLNIRGNIKAQDKVIRRQILLDEGELITNRKMDFSKNKVQLLNYFDAREGVNWKINRIDDEHADLDLLLKEVKTGKFNGRLGFGGSPTSKNSPQGGLTGQIEVGDRNLLGSGIDLDLSTELAKQYKAFHFSVRHPWVFDKPIRGQFSMYHKRSEYLDEVDLTNSVPQELVTGSFFGGGYVAHILKTDILIDGQIGFETIRFGEKVVAKKSFNSAEQEQIQKILDKNFQSGDQYWGMVTFAQDRRNGMMFPTNGYQFNWQTQLALPITTNAANPAQKGFSYFRTELDYSWYTPLIAPHTLILCLHAHLGFIKPLSGYNAPWRNLYHMGGPSTVRGYTYGQIGPVYRGDSLGASKAFHLNAELIVPVTSDLNTRLVLFYDGGAAWDSPYVAEWSKNDPSFNKYLENNTFFYRHSVGIGFRIKSPTPIQVDFGIKLNPSKKYRRSKNISQLHFTMEHSF